MKSSLGFLGLMLAAVGGPTLIAPPSLQAEPRVRVATGVPLPHGYIEVVVGRQHYYSHRGVFYRRARHGFVVVPAPQYLSVWMGDTEFLFKDGQFFRRTPEGLLWVEAPTGAISKTLPPDATSVWYPNVEYFDCDDVYFLKTPDGFRVVPVPWK